MTVLTRFGMAAIMAAASFAASAENITPNLKFNGFGTASVGVLDDDQGGQYIKPLGNDLGLNQSANASLESLIGLQFDYALNDQVNMVAQLVAQGSNNYEVNAEWAYIGYAIDDNWRLRGGRFALPSFMFSETIHVGQSYPWVRLPAEVYFGVPVTNFDGADMLFRHPIGSWNLNAQILAGGSNTDYFRTQNAIGANISLSNDNLTLRAGYIGSQLTLNSTDIVPDYLCSLLCLDQERNQLSNVGALYDDGKWFLAGEFAQLKVNGWVSDYNSGYLSAGYYFGKLLPFALWSTVHTFNEEECTSNPACAVPSNYKDQTTMALGARYALKNNVSVKGQIDHVSGFNNSTGLLSNPDQTPPDNFNVFTLSLNAAF
ncbi:MAG: porin [Moraxellaceae bacterium]